MSFWARLWRWLVGTPVTSRAGGVRVQDEASSSEVSDGVVDVEITDAIDLHTFQPREIVAVVDEYLRAARERGHAEVRVIHGRGKGVQRNRVRSLLKKHPDVAGFRNAPAHRGGWGATLVDLKPPKEPQEKPGR